MATDKQDIENQNRWKARYYEALGELEQKERYWRETERVLRHLVSRLSLAADTRHEALNRSLKELRSAIRDGRDMHKLASLIDTISNEVAQLDSMRKESASAPHAANLLVEVLDQLALPDKFSREYRQFRKHVNALRQNDNSAEAVQQFIAILNQLPAAPAQEAPEPSRKQKLLERILMRQQKPETPAEPVVEEDAANPVEPDELTQAELQKGVPQKFLAPAVGELLLQMALRMPLVVKQRINFPALKKHTNRARSRKDLIPIIDVITQNIDAAYKRDEPEQIALSEDSILALGEAVAQFFRQLEPPVDLKARVAELEQYWQAHTADVGGMVYCLNSLAEVVADICRRLAFQRDELESFFLQLSERLQDLDSGLKKTAALHDASQQSGAQMDAAVHAEMQGIQSSIQGTADLAELKRQLAARLDAIDHHLQSFREAGSARYAEAQQTITELTEKVTALENNSAELRSHLEATRQQALRDVLTGIANRQAYEERIAAEVARSKRYATPLCMVLWDIDHFKRINDSYGHAAGDRVIKVVAQLLNEKVRETDFVARIGGEEFALLMPETVLEAAAQVAEKLRLEIEQTPFHFRDTRVQVTVSAGIACYQQDEMVNNLFERTDAALYKAKQAGRNQIQRA